MKVIKAAALVYVATLVIACTQPEPVTVVPAEPTYDKYGNVVN
jgi:hypothetical protein